VAGIRDSPSLHPLFVSYLFRIAGFVKQLGYTTPQGALHLMELPQVIRNINANASDTIHRNLKKKKKKKNVIYRVQYD
jgi:hypothetical protein